MIKEEKIQTKVGVGVEALWRALSKDLNLVVPKAMPNFVKDVEIIEGDGGLGTILLFKFSGKSTMMYQKEKIVEFDESKCKIGLQVMEGGKLNIGFSSYTTFFELTAIGDRETLIDVKVVYETETEESAIPLETTNPTLVFIKCIEDYLLNDVPLSLVTTLNVVCNDA